MRLATALPRVVLGPAPLPRWGRRLRCRFMLLCRLWRERSDHHAEIPKTLISRGNATSFRLKFQVDVTSPLIMGTCCVSEQVPYVAPGMQQQMAQQYAAAAMPYAAHQYAGYNSVAPGYNSAYGFAPHAAAYGAYAPQVTPKAAHAFLLKSLSSLLQHLLLMPALCLLLGLHLTLRPCN